jgi:5-formyltetrahydrofolate cyclo-ligase
MTAFDRRGYRIGYGGGYYDATLAQIRASRSAPAIGIAFAAQEIARVPEEEHDQPLDLILTEGELIDCSLAWR